MATANRTITAPVLSTTTPLSFWGGISPTTGRVIDQTHPLHGESTSQKIFCLPSGRGSCTGSQVMLELILNEVSPKVLILREVDVILCVGVIIAEEFFEVMDAPVICVVGDEQFDDLISKNDDELTVIVNDGEDVLIESGTCTYRAKNLLRLEDKLRPHSGCLEEHQEARAKVLAMNTIRRVASISSATELIPITSAHIDAVTYIGPGGLSFVQKLVELGGKVSVPTTLNSQSCDRRRWKQLGVDSTYATNANAVGDAYLQMGCDEMSFTCAPYLLPTRPKKGEDIMWGESNAVVYSNSVLGARTEKYADYFDILAALVGVVPKVGVHISKNREPTVLIDAGVLIRQHLLPTLSGTHLLDKHILDSFFPAMGWLCGKLSDGRIPLICGFDALPVVTSDNLKAFCAAFGTTGTAPLFHMTNVTPEAKEDNVIKKLLLSCCKNTVVATKEDLRLAYEILDGSRNNCGDEVHLVALGNPHLSLSELKHLTEMINLDSRPKNEHVNVIACIGRHICEEGSRLNYIQRLEDFGITVVNDTCWCMMFDPPIIPQMKDAKILTNSAKYATYGPGLTSRRVRFGSTHDCIEASKSGRLSRYGQVPLWLRSLTTLAYKHLPK